MLRRVLAVAVCTAVAAASARAQVFDFNSVPAATRTPLTLTSGGVTATFSTPNPPYDDFDVIPGGTARGNVLASEFGRSLRVGFSQVLSAVSMRFYVEGASSTPSTLTLFAYDGPTLIGSATAAGDLFRPYETFLSFSGSGFTSIAFAASRYDGTLTSPAHFGLDDLTVQPQAGVVPEPATVVLLGAGLGLLGAAARRRRVTD